MDLSLGGSNTFVRCIYKCALKEGHLGSLDFPLSEVAIFPLKEIEARCVLGEDPEQSIDLDRLCSMEYIQTLAILDDKGVTHPRLDFELGHKYATPAGEGRAKRGGRPLK